MNKISARSLGKDTLFGVSAFDIWCEKSTRNENEEFEGLYRDTVTLETELSFLTSYRAMDTKSY